MSIFEGWLSFRKIQKRISVTRVLSFPSRWYEAQGSVVQKAARYGIPAITSDSSATRKLIEDGVTGM
jgi:glycosyltransferase involved in cell wall biosynthesis